MAFRSDPARQRRASDAVMRIQVSLRLRALSGWVWGAPPRVCVSNKPRLPQQCGCRYIKAPRLESVQNSVRHMAHPEKIQLLLCFHTVQWAGKGD